MLTLARAESASGVEEMQGTSAFNVNSVDLCSTSALATDEQHYILEGTAMDILVFTGLEDHN